MIELLRADTVGSYLLGRGIISAEPTLAKELTGGVSNVVMLVETATERVVLKQALPQLKVTDDWFADPARAQTEAAAIRLLHELSPEAMPALLDDDAERFTLVIEAAPPAWETWKDQLLAGDIDSEVGEKLGAMLRHWHLTTEGKQLPEIFEDLTQFEQLRIDPYFRVSAGRRPELAEALESLADDVLARRQTLVLGDFSPKNILVGDGQVWAIDHEVAHRGDPSFDVAFMLAHLAAKVLHSPTHSEQLSETAQRFLTAYAAGPGVADQAHLGRVFAGLLIARVAGASPLPYLDAETAAEMERRAAALLVNVPDRFEDTWKGMTEQ